MHKCECGKTTVTSKPLYQCKFCVECQKEIHSQYELIQHHDHTFLLLYETIHLWKGNKNDK